MTALEVRCVLGCGSAPGAVCLTPPWPGKGQDTRRPLAFSAAHPSRIAYAAALTAGATDAEALTAARAATTYPAGPPVPFLAAALAAVRTEQIRTVTTYRQHHPPTELDPPVVRPPAATATQTRPPAPHGAETGPTPVYGPTSAKYAQIPITTVSTSDPPPSETTPV